MGDGKARVGFDARQPLLRFVENIPRGLDRNVEGLVGDDVAPAEKVVVLAAGALELALQNAESVRVIVDAPHDRRLVLHGEPTTRGQAPHPFARRGDPLLKALRVLEVVSFRILGEELVWVLEVQHHVQADLRVGLVEPIEHRQEGAVEALGIERHVLGADADRLDAGFGQRAKPGRDL